MTAVSIATQHPPQRVSIIARVAERYSVDPTKLLDTLKATAFKGNVTNEQMMSLLIVADQYKLNPFTKEIYAFPDKGGIVPVVGVDGWARIINDHPQFDGLEFESTDDAVTCTIYRKDRGHPTRVTEFMRECKRDTGPWKSHPHRMLRHKAMIQSARLAFGFSGIYDPDEGERIRDAVHADHATASSGVDRVRSLVAQKSAPAAEVVDSETGEIEAPPRTLAQLKAAIDEAGDSEVAALVLDQARDELDATDNAMLAEHYRARWTDREHA